MADFIDREAVLTKIDQYTRGCWPTVSYVESIIKEQPAADVEPVQHGRWKPVFDAEAFRGDPEAVAEDEITGYECSICGRPCAFTDGNGEYVLPDVCLGCGSKMDGGTGNEM